MEYHNDYMMIGDLKKAFIRNILIIYTLSLISILPSLYFSLRKSPNWLFILLSTAICCSVSVFIGIILRLKIINKTFSSYCIRVSDEKIEIIEGSKSIVIKNDNISEIIIDKKYTIFLVINRLHKMKLSEYILNKEELLRILETKFKIKKMSNVFDIVNNLPFILLICLLFVKFIPELRIYLVVALAFVVTTIYSTAIQFFVSGNKTRLIFMLSINCFLIYIVAKGIIKVISALYIIN